MKKISEEIKKVFESKIVVGVLIGIGALLVLLVVFAAGMNLGFRRASFGDAWQRNYERNFGAMQRGRLFPGFGPESGNLPNAYGATGKIVKVSLPVIIVEDKDNTEKTVLIGNGTDIRERRENISSSNLKTGDFVVVIGNPNQNGQIAASLIRVMPDPNLIFNNSSGTTPSGN